MLLVPKISFNAEDLWIIRGSRRDGVRYFETISMWNRSPAHATMFRSYDAAVSTMAIAHDFRLEGEVLDAVPLYTCLTYGGAPR